jgi:hypothetical protein
VFDQFFKEPLSTQVLPMQTLRYIRISTNNNIAKLDLLCIEKNGMPCWVQILVDKHVVCDSATAQWPLLMLRQLLRNTNASCTERQNHGTVIEPPPIPESQWEGQALGQLGMGATNALLQMGSTFPLLVVRVRIQP